ncbi:DotU family type IV/VI secretion system protein [Sorangium sp. So ce1389]|uniref:DotU family type IV/VI secretion system protein n=1 Tax=Sorangium sp. So ce1389 TaxID=3133336 RepID=UPI003F5FCB18
MGSTTALWFGIEEAFAEVDALCVEARAAELALERRKREEAAVRSLGGGRTMAMEEDAPRVERDRRSARAAELAKDLAFQETHPDGADFVKLRARVRQRLVWLKGQLSGTLPEHEVHYVLFPIVVHFDELVRLVSRGATTRWEPLQSELYDVDNGGELFYTRLEERLNQEETPPIVFEVFYFCLSDGFQGMHQGDAKKIAEYKARIQLRIPKKPVEDVDDESAGAPVELVRFPVLYYAAALGAMVGLYAVLSWLGGSL